MARGAAKPAPPGGPLTFENFTRAATTAARSRTNAALIRITCMKTTVALFLLLGAAPLFGQYAPPARDLDEAIEYVRELTRQLEPAIKEARDQAHVFGLVARAANKLSGKEPATELAAAKELIDNFVEQRERSGNELSRENLKTLASVRQELELAQPPYAILALRDRLHHEFVHVLERKALRDLQRVDQMKAEWEVLMQRHVQAFDRTVMSGIEITAAPVQ